MTQSTREPGYIAQCMCFCGCERSAEDDEQVVLNGDGLCPQCAQGNCPPLDAEQRWHLQCLYQHDMERQLADYIWPEAQTWVERPVIPAFFGRGIIEWLIDKSARFALWLSGILYARMRAADPRIKYYDSGYIAKERDITLITLLRPDEVVFVEMVDDEVAYQSAQLFREGERMVIDEAEVEA